MVTESEERITKKENNISKEENRMYITRDIRIIDIPIKEYTQRTLQDFVEDLMSDGRTESEILCVAFCTRWQSKMEEVKENVKILKRRITKRKHSK